MQQHGGPQQWQPITPIQHNQQDQALPMPLDSVLQLPPPNPQFAAAPAFYGQQLFPVLQHYQQQQFQQPWQQPSSLGDQLFHPVPQQQQAAEAGASVEDVLNATFNNTLNSTLNNTLGGSPARSYRRSVSGRVFTPMKDRSKLQFARAHQPGHYLLHLHWHLHAWLHGCGCVCGCLRRPRPRMPADNTVGGAEGESSNDPELSGEGRGRGRVGH